MTGRVVPGADRAKHVGRELGVRRLGSLISPSMLGRVHVGEWSLFQPTIDAGVGYEWLSTTMSSDGVESTRSYRGFTATVAGNAMLRMSSRVELGLRFELRCGTFHRAGLEAPGISGARVGDRAHHAEHVAQLQRIERAERLVEHHDRPLHSEREIKSDAFSFAAREHPW